MPTKKKAAGPASRAAAVTPVVRPQRSEAYEAAIRDYASALTLVRNGEYATALEQFRSICETNADEPELADRARTYAAFCSRKLAPPAPRPVTADDCYNLGVVRTNEGRLEEAIALFGEALQKETGSARVLYARASARALQGNLAAAVADLRQAIAADSKLRYQATNDPDFERIRDEAAFIDVIEPTPAGA